MRTDISKNEQGFALVLELVVVVLVLTAVGVGLYQYHSHSTVATKTPATAVSKADDVNEALIKSANIEANDSTNAEAMSDELKAADAAGADTEGGIDEGLF